MCLVWRKEYYTVMLKTLPLDLIFGAIFIFIFAVFLYHYWFFRVFCNLLEFLSWLLNFLIIILDNPSAFSILCLWCGSLCGQSCFR